MTFAHQIGDEDVPEIWISRNKQTSHLSGLRCKTFLSEKVRKTCPLSCRREKLYLWKMWKSFYSKVQGFLFRGDGGTQGLVSHSPPLQRLVPPYVNKVPPPTIHLSSELGLNYTYLPFCQLSTPSGPKVSFNLNFYKPTTPTPCPDPPKWKSIYQIKKFWDLSICRISHAIPHPLG